MSEQPDSRPDDRGDAPAGGAARKHGRLRPLTWLGTLSTVVAVATGMFTLRDQILPSDSGNAMASTTSYEQSIGHVCDLVNQTISADPGLDAELGREVRAATTPLAQRDAVLTRWKQALGDSQQELAAFEGLDPPASLRARQRTTDRAWNVIVTQTRRFVEQLENTNSSGLRALVSELPALDASVSKEEQTRSSGLVNLGGGECTLSAPLTTPIVTLPLLSSSRSPAPGTPGKPSTTHFPAGKQASQPGQPTPPVNPTSAVVPVVNPPTTVTAPVNRTATVTPPVNPPASPTPPVNPGFDHRIHIIPGDFKLLPSQG